jgi:hypothetical protein
MVSVLGLVAYLCSDHLIKTLFSVLISMFSRMASTLVSPDEFAMFICSFSLSSRERI